MREETKRLGLERGDFRFSRRELRERTGWGDTQLKVHLGRLAELEYVLVHRGRQGQSYGYELCWSASEEDGPFLPRFDRRGSAGARRLTISTSRGSDPNFAGGGRPSVGPRSGGGRGGQDEAKPQQNSGARDLKSDRADKARRGNGQALVVRARSRSGAASGRELMPPKQGKKKKAPRVIGDPHDPEGFGVWVRRYLEWLAVRNYSPRTVGNAESSLRLFVEWCAARSLARPVELTKPILERYQRHLYHLRRPDGRPQLSFRSQHVRLSAVRGFFRWLVKQNVLSANPASELELPRLPARLPRRRADGGGGGAGDGAAGHARRRSACGTGPSSRSCTRRGSGGARWWL